MKIKLDKLISSVGALRLLSQNKLPAALAVKIARLLREVSEEVENYQQLANQQVEKLGGKLQPDGTIKFDADEAKKYMELNNYLKEIRDQGIELSRADFKITIDDIAKNIDQIEPSVLADLDWLIEDK